ncbi:MAG: cobalamin-dependent protein [Methanomassiliicoccales archaeon]|jgi:5-methyltetrahydrofolate--homocysteine methyltransferase
MVNYRDLANAVIVGNVKVVTSIVDKALNAEKKSPIEIIEKGLAPGMDVIGERFAKGEAFLVDVIVAANAFKKAMEMVRPHFKATDKKIGTAVMGTVEGDIHDLGKNLACVALEVSGFNVVDLGNDVKPSTFSSAAKSSGADVIGMSTLITTTMVNLKKVIDRLVEDGIRGEVKVICGGAPVDKTYVKEIGGDLYGKNAFEGADVIKRALGVQ